MLINVLITDCCHERFPLLIINNYLWLSNAYSALLWKTWFSNVNTIVWSSGWRTWRIQTDISFINMELLSVCWCLFLLIMLLSSCVWTDRPRDTESQQPGLFWLDSHRCECSVQTLRTIRITVINHQSAVCFYWPMSVRADQWCQRSQTNSTTKLSFISGKNINVNHINLWINSTQSETERLCCCQTKLQSVRHRFYSSTNVSAPTPRNSRRQW